MAETLNEQFEREAPRVNAELARREVERKARIKACQHTAPRAAGHGYAMCDDCGAMLPDEDPDLYAKATAK